MLSIDQLLESDGLFITRLPTGQSFTWRLLTLKEYTLFRALRESGTYTLMVLHGMVFDRCYLGISDAINPKLPAGIFISIGQLIMHLSGDTAGMSQRVDIETARASYPGNSVHEHLKHVVMMAFPSYTIEVIEGWTRPMLLRRFAMAETLLVKSQSGYEPMDLRKITSPSEASKASHKPPVDFAADNAELNRAMGDREHILDQHPSVLADRAKRSAGIGRRQARKLDQAARNNPR